MKKTTNKLLLSFEVIQVSFVVLKIVGIVSWSWWVVMIPAIFFFATVLITLISILVISALSKL